MDRKKSKVKWKYIDKLDPEPDICRNFFFFLNGFNDPYDSAEGDWSTSLDFVPSMDFAVLMHYLIYGVSVYTRNSPGPIKALKLTCSSQMAGSTI